MKITVIIIVSIIAIIQLWQGIVDMKKKIKENKEVMKRIEVQSQHFRIGQPGYAGLKDKFKDAQANILTEKLYLGCKIIAIATYLSAIFIF